MIGQLQGVIIEKKPPLIILDVQGVGYEVHVPLRAFYQLPELHQTLKILTHLIVREDAHILYGFMEERERALFRALIKVNGVGPKLALTILSGIEPDHFVQCIKNQNASGLTGIPGVGKKTAERLIMETRDALSQWEISNSDLSNKEFGDNQELQDAISALTALGYKPALAKKAVSNIYNAELNSAELIRLALKEMVK